MFGYHPLIVLTPEEWKLHWGFPKVSDQKTKKNKDHDITKTNINYSQYL